MTKTICESYEPIKPLPSEQDIKQAERRELFKQVALKSLRVSNSGLRAAMLMEQEWNRKETERITDEILKAAEQFAQQSADEFAKGEG